MRIFALKALLSAKLYEDKIIMIESDKIDYGKTSFLDEIIAPFKNDKLLFLTDFTMDKNFKLAQ